MSQEFASSIDPAMVETLAVALEDACRIFAGAHNGQFPNESLRNAIAVRMINSASEGETDIHRIIVNGLRGTMRVAA